MAITKKNIKLYGNKHKRSKHKRSKHKRSKHKRSKHKRSKQEGGFDFSDFEFSLDPAMNIASKTLSVFLANLLQSSDDFDTATKTKYHFSTYENMINVLETFSKDTIAGHIISSLNDKQELPSIISIFSSLRIVPSNIVYLFCANPTESVFQKPIKDFIPKKISEKYLGQLDLKTTMIMEDFLTEVLNPVLMNQPFVCFKNKSFKPPSQGTNKILGPTIIEQIKNFIMKFNFMEKKSNGLYLSTLLLELITNIVHNLGLTHNSEENAPNKFNDYLKELNEKYIISSDLLSVLIENKFDLVFLYRNFNKESETDSAPLNVTDEMKEYTIMNFFDKSKNSNGILPPFILLLLSLKINPSAKNEDIKKYIDNSIKDNSIKNKSSSKPGTFSKLSTKMSNLFKRNNQTQKLSTVNENKQAEEEEEEEEYFDAEEEEYSDAPKIIIKPGEEIGPTTCTEQEPTILTKFAKKNVIIPILKKIQADLEHNRLSWNSFDGLKDMEKIIRHIKMIGLGNTLIENLCYNLAPYTTFLPFNINDYFIHTLLKLNSKSINRFNSRMNTYEKAIIEHYRKNSDWQGQKSPQCVPLTLMEEIKKSGSRDTDIRT